MKKLYALTLLLMVSFSGMAQVFYSENMGTPSGTTPIATNVFQNGTVTYSGTADVRATSASTGYTGASGAGNVFITNTAGKYFQIDGLNTSAYASADLELSFGLNASTNLPVLEQSTNGGTSWTAITYTTTGTGAWKFVTVGAGVIPSSTTLSLRWSQLEPVPASNNQYRIDDVKLRNGSDTCTMSLGTGTAVCDAFTSGLDTYTATIPFTGAGNATYSIVASSGTIGGDIPSSSATGNIIITGITEGVALNVTITGGTCNLAQDIAAPQCSAVNPLPFKEPFNYTPGTLLTANQTWATLNSGDDILIGDGSLTYTGLTPTGNSAYFSGAGKEAFTKTTPTTSGTIYAAFLVNIAAFPDVPFSATAQTYFAAFYGGSTTFNARVFFKRSGDQYMLGGTNATASTPAETAFSATLFNTGETVLVVIGYDFTNNELKFWFNPTVAGFSAATPASVTETPTAPITAVNGFLFRQDDNNQTPLITIDELSISNDITTVLAVANNTITGLKVYPNPVTNGKLFIETSANAEKAVVIYDVLGKVVVNTTTATNEVNVSNLKGGVYIVKITEEGNTATRKLVIR